MNRNRLLIILVAILVVMNAGLLSFLWLNKPDYKRTRGDRERQKRVENYFSKKLDLSEEQERLFEQQRKKHFRETRALMKDIQADREEMITMLQNGADSLAIEQVLARINEKNNDVERLNFWHLRNLREICDDNQQKRFDKIMHRIGEPRPNQRVRSRP
ncbi:Spy/CpxP family protein refolding chaperone [Fulvivirga ligni]|uniref:Spy/CpxP family protein refolding chaperone n=1 Tax=Fulvivirga ligni TaxID=2904246 RepID=UPI001F2A7812|nr:periplasmic heavy metal sensor [Fulvivirga ligni]UII23107.1 periplasmic heavy metal sensor [Fulvivirga ligni]